MLFVTGADLYSAKNFLAQKFGEEIKPAERLKEVCQYSWRHLVKRGLEIGTDEKDGSVKYGVVFIIPEIEKRAGEWCMLSNKETIQL